MTDYIALALEDQEERENNETAELLLEQHGTAGVRRRKAREQGPEEPAAEGGGVPLLAYNSPDLPAAVHIDNFAHLRSALERLPRLGRI